MPDNSYYRSRSAIFWAEIYCRDIAQNFPAIVILILDEFLGLRKVVFDCFGCNENHSFLVLGVRLAKSFSRQVHYDQPEADDDVIDLRYAENIRFLNPTVTLRIYAHLFGDTDERASNAVESALGAILTE